MTTDLALRRPELVRLDTDQIQYLAHTEFVNDRIRGNLPAIFATIATGREIGIGDMAALRHIHYIDNKPSFSAEIMVVVARRDGHSIQGDVTEDRATVVGVRKDNGDTMSVTWTLAMADRAGLLSKQNWKKYPEAMLWARAVSQLCRELFADCFAGATYVPEELEASGGDPTADEASAYGESADAPVPQADIPDEPASPPVDMWDPDIPFGDSPPPQPKYINKRQRDRLWTIATKCGVSEDDLRVIVLEFVGEESTKLIQVGSQYDGIVAAVQAKGA